ncbi:MAG TPA: ATP-binding protein [Chitinophagales bacterium]|nr:ATP-binding protein [Chitinophagales bacterium]
MIKYIQIKNYRCLAYIASSLNRFHVLVGANATGKTTFFDVISFLGDIIKSRTIDEAINKRITKNGTFDELTFSKQGGDIEFAVELEIPQSIRKNLWNSNIDTIRYEICLGLVDENYGIGIKDERVVVFISAENTHLQPTFEVFPIEKTTPSSIMNLKYKKSTARQILKKNPKGDSYYSELLEQSGKGWIQSFRLGNKISALGSLPEDENKFPATIWLKNYLSQHIQLFVLDSLNMRMTSSPDVQKNFQTDGSNLPWIIHDLQVNHPKKFARWIAHLQTALPDIKDIRTVEVLQNRHLYLEVHYKNDIVVPSWLVSDGTLRLLALTLPAYLPNLSGLFLIEEPENGIHPKAIEMVFQSLSSVYNAQIFIATHSPVILSMTKPEQVLCFAKTPKGATDIVSGNNHPMLKDWHGEVNLSTLYAGGILG